MSFPLRTGRALQESQPTLDQDTDPTAASRGKDGWQGLHSDNEGVIKNHPEILQELPPKAGLASSCTPDMCVPLSQRANRRSQWPEEQIPRAISGWDTQGYPT